MLDFLQAAYEENPGLTSLDLSKRGIKTLTPLMSVLLKMTKLTSLDLSENNLEDIPKNFIALRALEDLNLSGNELNDTVIETLGGLPGLISLYINLNTEEDVEHVILNIKQLEVLNGLEIDREELKKESEEQDVFEDDEQEPIAEHTEEDEEPGPDKNNLVPEAARPLQALGEQTTVPSKFMSDIYDDESKSIRPDVTGLQFNKFSAEEHKIQEVENEEYGSERPPEQREPLPMVGGISQQEFEEIAIVFDSIRGLCGQYQPHKDAELEAEYENHLASSLQDIQKDPQNRKKSLLVKLSFYDLCAKHFLSFLHYKDESAAAVYENLQNSMNKIFAELLASTGESTPSIAPSPRGPRPEDDRRMRAMDELIRLYSSEKEEMKKQMENLEAENKRLMEHMVRHSKSAAGGAADKREPLHPLSSSQQQQYTDETDHSQPRSRKFMKNINLSGSIGPTNQRTLSLKQLKEVVSDIYSQKIKYDQKCEQAHLPRETMEQFMYTYLNQRYGLKNLIIEWASAIINGIRRFSKQDHDVALFGKIMKNECDEEFRFIQLHVKETIVNLMKAYLKERFVNKSERDINRLLQNIQQGSIDQWLWKRVIDKMYDIEDCQMLEKTCIEMMRSAGSDADKRRKMTREEQFALLSKRSEYKLTFKDFQKCVLDFQLKEHEKFLKKFVQIFRDIDSDSNGMLSEEEFRVLVSRMGLNPGDVDYFLQIIDPYNNKQMTFSEIVHLFSSHMVPLDEGNPTDQVALLEKFARED